jgi:hypothetical protein
MSKKFKLDRRIDSLKFYREIAYQGKVGWFRKNFCTEYIEYKKSLLKKLKNYRLSKKKLKVEILHAKKAVISVVPNLLRPIFKNVSQLSIIYIIMKMLLEYSCIITRSGETK